MAASISRSFIKAFKDTQVTDQDEFWAPNHFQSLPDDILLLIFHYLDIQTLCIAAQVSLHWRCIAYDNSLWKSINFNQLYDLSVYDNPEQFSLLADTRFYNTEKLHLGHLKITDGNLNSITDRCQNLKTLVFGRQEVNDVVGTLARHPRFVTNLKTLDIRMVMSTCEHFDSPDLKLGNLVNLGIGPCKFTPGSYSRLFTSLSALRVLDTTNCYEITDADVESIGYACKNLESVNFNNCRGIVGKSLESLLKNCPSIKTLLLRYLKIEDDILMKDFWADTILDELDLSACPNLTWQGLWRFLPMLRCIRYLNLSYCGMGHAVSDEVLTKFRNEGNLTKLEMMDIRWAFFISPLALLQFLEKCPSLQYLGVYQSLRITTNVICEATPHLKSLRMLEFGCVVPEDFASSQILCNIQEHCKNLEVVSLINFDTTNIDADYLRIQEFMAKMEHLVRMNFCDCNGYLAEAARTGKTDPNISITEIWECCLPAPSRTLDNMIGKMF